MVHHIGWSEPRVELLRKGWAEGLSAAQIAKELGGTTRNAVIGKVHRLGLPLQNPRINKKRPRRQRIPLPKPPKFNPETPPPLCDELVRIASLAPIEPTLGVLGLTNFTCRFPIGDPTDPAFTFCGRTCNNVENPYCVQHAKLCFQPSQAKKRKHDETARLANWMDRRSFEVAA